MTDPNETLKTHKPNGFGHDTFDNLTKREYFAAMAMQGLFSQENNSNTIDEDAIVSVKAADALIKAINEKAENNEKV